jgi:ATP-dependent Clp protease ATP-binding subunit ClpC
VNITYEAIEKAVVLSKRYILDKYLPDKAIDLIDEACSRKASKTISKEKELKIEKLINKISELENKIKKAVEEQDYFTAADYKEKITNYNQQIHKLHLQNDTPKELRPNIVAEDIEKVIAEKYGISSKILSKSEIDFLADLKNILNKEII